MFSHSTIKSSVSKTLTMNQTYIAQDINGPVLAAVFATEMILALIANGVVLFITITQRKSWKQPSTIFFISYKKIKTPNFIQIFGRTRYAAAPKFDLLAAETEKL